MPMGPTMVGVGIFTGVKLLGYSLAGMQLNIVFKSTKINPIFFGLVHTAVGVLAGIASFTLLAPILSGWIYVALIPIRLGEWTLMMFWCYTSDGFKFKLHW